jgi:large subunit ribosomal protein L1
LKALLDTLMKLKPQTSKGIYMRSVTISTTHGPGIKVDTAAYAGGGAE